MQYRQKIKVPHDVYIPDGVDELQYEYVEVDDTEYDFDEGESNTGPTGELDLPVPQAFTIISQTVRESKDGSQVVDIAIEVTDLDGYEVEVRTTKIGMV